MKIVTININLKVEWIRCLQEVNHSIKATYCLLSMIHLSKTWLGKLYMIIPFLCRTMMPISPEILNKYTSILCSIGLSGSKTTKDQYLQRKTILWWKRVNNLKVLTMPQLKQEMIYNWNRCLTTASISKDMHTIQTIEEKVQELLPDNTYDWDLFL